MNSPSLLLVGCGKMGGALLARWQEKFPQAKIAVIEPGAAQAGWHKNLVALPKDFNPDIIIFAVKPQQLAEILPSYRQRFSTAPLYISIAAGKTLGFLAGHLGSDARIVRAMPSLPAT
ncbi:MAG: NAD(P)-binding domain-containing protein, partial [Pseudomonadota bacterium]|nr:NAD(P)-binding domain-containing protein [Pseudomonadota bacterium]